MKILHNIFAKMPIWLPFAWLLIFFLAAFFLVAKIALSNYALAVPPYAPTFTFNIQDILAKIKLLSFENFFIVTIDSLYVNSYISSLRIAFIATFCTLLIGYPLAYGIARAPAQLKPLLVMLVILPFWTSFLIRVYAWIGILKKEGLLNQLLLSLGIINEPLAILHTELAVFIGIAYSYLPFMVLPLYANLDKQDFTLLEAANDLGCSKFSAFWKITFPLSRPGLVAGCLLVFIPAIGEFVIPELLGGTKTLMIGRIIWNEFFLNRDWPTAAAIAILLLAFLLVPIIYFQNIEKKTT